MTRRILVVGAGFAGAVHARELAEHGFEVTVIDRRPHIAGNCFDQVDASGVRRHLYGPHLFHTNSQPVVDWLSRFTDWLPYEHEVMARLPDGRLAPLPVNLETVNLVFGTHCTDAAQVQAVLDQAVTPRDPIQSAEDHLYTTIGPTLTDLFFRPYTKKMWGRDLAQMDPAVVRRLKIRMDRNRQYFLNDTFQALPKLGYTHAFENILDHDRITLQLSTDFAPDMLSGVSQCFNSMPIDEYFGFCFGELPYRSIRFHTTQVPLDQAEPHAVINYTDDGPYTRETWWHTLPGHHVTPGPTVPRTIEEPCDYRDNGMERYYPVKTDDGRYDQLYARYKTLAEAEGQVTFIGRCGTYQYLDMHQVINQSLQGVRKWIAQHG